MRSFYSAVKVLEIRTGTLYTRTLAYEPTWLNSFLSTKDRARYYGIPRKIIRRECSLLPARLSRFSFNITGKLYIYITLHFIQIAWVYLMRKYIYIWLNYSASSCVQADVWTIECILDRVIAFHLPAERSEWKAGFQLAILFRQIRFVNETRKYFNIYKCNLNLCVCSAI